MHLANEQKALDQRYTAELERGDKAFGLNDWVTAKQAYQSALALKSGEAYPKAQVVKIDALLVITSYSIHYTKLYDDEIEKKNALPSLL